MRSQLLVLVSLLALVAVGTACRITVKLRSQTKHKFRIQVHVPSIQQKSQRILFTEPGEKKITVTGNDCARLHWVVRTWKPDGAGGWVNAKEVKAKLDGNGWMRVNVGDDLMPFFLDRSGVSCMDGFCG